MGKIRVGIAEGMYGHTYRPFLETMLMEIGLEPVFSLKSNQEMLLKGSMACVDEVCLPIKLLAGHIIKLAEECDYVFVPRIMKNEYGESICPKVCAIPELVLSNGYIGNSRLLVTPPLNIQNFDMALAAFWELMLPFNISVDNFCLAVRKGYEAQKNTCRGWCDSGYDFRVFLAGHPYNIYDEFANRWLMEKLHKLGIGIITEECIERGKKAGVVMQELNQGILKKEPYWSNFANIYGAAKYLMKERAVDGVIYVSSFSCGIDSVIVTILRNALGDFPFLLLKLDEQQGEAGYDTRIEAFREILEAAKWKRS